MVLERPSPTVEGGSFIMGRTLESPWSSHIRTCCRDAYSVTFPCLILYCLVCKSVSWPLTCDSLVAVFQESRFIV